MATTKVSELSALTTTDGAEELLINDGGTSKKVTIANLLHDNSIDSDHYVDGSIDTAHFSADCITADEIGDNIINSEHYAAGSIDLEHMSSESVDEDNLYISNSGSNGQFLSKQSGNNGGLTWASDTDTTYSVQDGELSQNNFTNTDHTKLNGIEASADVTDATNVTSAGALMDSELAGIAAVKATTGTFLSADESKLDGIEASADVTDTTNVTAAGALMDSELAGIAAVKATTGTFLSADESKLDAIEASADVTDATNVGTVVNGKQTIWIPANAMNPTESNGCSAITGVETTSGRPDMQVLDFDKDSDEFAQFTVAFPKSWNLGVVTYQVFWSGIAATSDVDWSVQGVAMNDNETIDVAYGTAIVVTDNAQGAVEELLVSSESTSVTIAGTSAANDLTYFRIGRDVSGDAMAGDARLHGVKVFFTTNALNDA